ncbi:inhibitor of Bruton tyrosine kinase-like isoform X3 [Corticium candelabrum]|nr:inhibitor of Bruton tyrosine kinase-like isoform X3 [Corticium candelabrum]
MGPASANVIQVLLCKFHSVFLATDGRVFTCGHGHGGRLGHGDEQSHVVPKQIEFLKSVKCVCIAAARDHTVFLSDGGEVSTCGLNDCCQLGYGGSQSSSCKQSLSPRWVKFFKGQRVTHVAAGRYHTAVCTENELYTWGRNIGQLGYSGTDIMQYVPKQVTGLLKGFKMLLLCASDSATACCTSNGDTFVLIDYTCRKIAVSPFSPSELPLDLCISASLAYRDSESDINVGMVVLLALTKYGEVWKWSPGLRAMSRCRWLNKNGCIKSIVVADVKVGREVYLVSVKGQLYKGSFVQPKISDERVCSSSLFSASGPNKATFYKKPLEWHVWKCREADREAKSVVVLERLQKLHRVVKVFCDFKGQNVAVLCHDPILSLSQFPQISLSSFAADMQLLLDEADPLDSVHDVLVKVGESHNVLPLHKVVLASQSSYFRDLFAIRQSSAIEVKNIELNVFTHLLSFLYTGKLEAVSDTVTITCSSGSKECEVFSLSEDGQTDGHKDFVHEDLIGCLFNLNDVSQQLHEDTFCSDDETESVTRLHSESWLISTQFAGQGFAVESGANSETTQTPLSPNSTSAFAMYQAIKQEEEQEVKSHRKQTPSHRDSNVLSLAVEKLYEASIRFKVTGLTRRLEEMYSEKLRHARSLKLELFSGELLEQKSCSHLHDVTLIAEDGISIGCHKCILVARSEYFRSMLTMGWKETVSGPLSLYLHFSSMVMQVVVDFIYSDEAALVNSCNDLNFIGSVLTAADQMLMVRLKEICEAAISRLMTVRTVVEILEFSDLYGASQLKTAALTFISCNLADLLEGGCLNNLSRSLADDITAFYRNLIPDVACRVLKMSAVSFDEVQSVGYLDCLNGKEQANKRKFSVRHESTTSPDVNDGLGKMISGGLEDLQPKMGMQPESGCLMYQSSINIDSKKEVKNPPLQQECFADQSSFWSQQSFQVRSTSLAEIMVEEEESGKQLHLRKTEQMIGRQPSVKQNPCLMLKEEGNPAIKWSVGGLGKSQKQRRRLSSDKSSLSSLNQSPSPSSWKPVWQRTSNPVVSFRHLIAEQLENYEDNQEKDYTVSLCKQDQSACKSREVTSPPRGWCVPCSPTESLANIVRLQEQKTLEESQRSLNKPLVIIQIEDRAIDELLDYYGGPFHPAESIEVMRVIDMPSKQRWKRVCKS